MGTTEKHIAKIFWPLCWWVRSNLRPQSCSEKRARNREKRVLSCPPSWSLGKQKRKLFFYQVSQISLVPYQCLIQQRSWEQPRAPRLRWPFRIFCSTDTSLFFIAIWTRSGKFGYKKRIRGPCKIDRSCRTSPRAGNYWYCTRTRSFWETTKEEVFDG